MAETAPARPSLTDGRAPDRLEDWNVLPEAVQIVLAREAMQVAIGSVIAQAEQLSRHIANGVVPDLGGSEALLLFASLLRAARQGAAVEDRLASRA